MPAQEVQAGEQTGGRLRTSPQLKRRHGREQQDVAASAGQEDRQALVQSEGGSTFSHSRCEPIYYETQA